MSLATSIKDFSDTLNHVYTVKASSLPILPFLQEFFVWSVKTILSGVVYIFTFEWFRDFSYLPLLNCEHLPGTGEIFGVTAATQQHEMVNGSNSLFHNFSSGKGEALTVPPILCVKHFGNTFFTDPVSHFFSVFDFPKERTNYMLSGLVNSFFFSLPFSLPHLISIRRLFSQGIQAAVASLLGTIAAHSLFLICVFYGLRFLIIPWFSLEPITYILGFTVNVLIIRELIQASPQRFHKSMATRTYNEGVSGTGVSARSLSELRSAKNPLRAWFLQGNGLLALSQNLKAANPLAKLIRIGVLNFILTWCEELNLFSSITNLSLNAQNTYLDLYPSNDAPNSFLIYTVYILAFIIGNCVFSLCFYYILFKSGSIIASRTNFSSIKIVDAINKLVMLFIITFTFASFPYYGLDYLFGKIGGFLPEDPAYKETVLSPTKVTVNKKNTLFTKAESTDKKKHTSLIDINNFDNGVYLNNLDLNKFDNFPSDSKGSISRTTSFEKSNYRQENAWIRRNYLAKLRARPRKKNNSTGTASFYKAFKDPKAYYHKIQLESDKKQNKNIREEQAKNKKRFGYFVERQEGVLVDEQLFKTQDFWSRIFNLPRDLVLQAMSYKTAPTGHVNADFARRSDAKRVERGEHLRRNPGSLNSNTEKIYEIDTQIDPTTKLPFASDFTILQNNKNKFKESQDEFFGSNTNTSSNQKDSSLDTETTLFAENYTKGIQKRNSVPSVKKTKILSTKNVIKRKFFLNPVYRALLQTDIDAFIARQPVTHNIAENQDYNLYKKRVILQKYYNWLRYYSPLQTNLQDLYDIATTKSFVDSVFHHQFKGTLKIAKRLFPVTFDSQQNSKKNRVLSYDQTLYKDLSTQENPLLHEEISLTRGRALGRNSGERRVVLAPTRSETPSNNPRSGLYGRASAPSKFEELDQKLRLQEPTFNNSPFIEESDSSPFYAGWDDTLRRFVITNNFLINQKQ